VTTHCGYWILPVHHETLNGLCLLIVPWCGAGWLYKLVVFALYAHAGAKFRVSSVTNDFKLAVLTASLGFGLVPRYFCEACSSAAASDDSKSSVFVPALMRSVPWEVPMLDLRLRSLQSEGLISSFLPSYNSTFLLEMLVASLLLTWSVNSLNDVFADRR
jgi:hypothetical protein